MLATHSRNQEKGTVNKGKQHERAAAEAYISNGRMRTDKSAQIAAAADTKIINAGVNRHSYSVGAHSSCAQKLCLAYNVEGRNEDAPDCAEQHQQIMIKADGIKQQQNNCYANNGDAEEMIAAFVIPFGKGGTA